MKSQSEILQERIILLENRQLEEITLLKEQLHDTLESLKPINLLKNTIHNVSSSPELKEDLISNAIGLTTGYISRKIILGTAHNPITKIMGAVLQFTIGNLVAKNSDTIKAVGEVLLNKISNRITESKHSSLENEINNSLARQMSDY
jgi:hypothetical protein